MRPNLTERCFNHFFGKSEVHLKSNRNLCWHWTFKISAQLTMVAVLSVIISVRVNAETLPVISVVEPTVQQIMEGTQPQFQLRADKQSTEDLEINFLVEQTGDYIGPYYYESLRFFPEPQYTSPDFIEQPGNYTEILPANSLSTSFRINTMDDQVEEPNWECYCNDFSW